MSGTNVVVPVEEADRAHIIESPQVSEGFNELAPQPSLLEGGEAKLFESILVAAVAQLRDELGRTMLDAFQLRYVPPHVWRPELDCLLEVGTDEGLVERQHYVFRFAEEVTRDKASITVCYLVAFLDLGVSFQVS